MPSVRPTNAQIPATSVLVSDEVNDALADGRGVVALESTIFSHLGLPSPSNSEALDRCMTAVRSSGSVPAVTAIVDGQPRVGLALAEHERILGPATKAAARDLSIAVAQRWDVGATTVSGALALATAAGVTVFATGGIGGVHRGADVTGDVSADLDAIAMAPAVTVSAGAKAFLDLARTLEYLETASVPVVGFGTNDFPAFYTRSSGLEVPHRMDTAAEVSELVRARRSLGQLGGVLVAVPVPTADALDQAELDRVLEQALADAERAAITGPAITPFVLGRIGEATEGRSVPTNLALAENNALVAGQIAAELGTSGAELPSPG